MTQQSLIQLISSQIITSPYSSSAVVQLFTPTLIASMLPLLPTPSSITLTSFMKSTLKLLPLSLNNRPKLIHSLFKLFQQICKTKDQEEFSWEQFTSFLANKTPDMSRGQRIQEKVLPHGIEIDSHIKHRIKPPQVIGSSAHQLRRLHPNMTSSDRLHHINRKIERACYSPGNKLFFVLDSPSKYIDVLDRQYTPKYRLTTTELLSSKEAIIISMDWSESTSRIGCIFANYSTSFWAFADEFKYQVICPLKLQYIKQPPTKIYYFRSQEKWIKYNTKPIIYTLNNEDFEIEDTFSHNKLTKQDSTSIVLISQVIYHKLLIIGFQRSVSLLSLSRKQLTTSILTPQTNVYSLSFSQTYQTLLISCFQNYIYCYQLSEFCDLSLKGKLINNLQISTSIACIPDSPIVVSVQDNSHVKLWNVCDCNSFQYFMTYKNLEVREMMVVENGVVLVGSKLLEFSFESERREDDGEYSTFADIWVNRNIIVAVGTQSISIYNCETGWPERIIKSPMESSSIALSCLIETQNYIILISEESTLKIINLKDGEVLIDMVLKEKKVIGVKYDNLSNMICIGSEDEVEFLHFHQFYEVHPKRNLKIKGGQMSMMRICSYHDLVMVGFEKERVVELFTFEKFVHVKSVEVEFVPMYLEVIRDNRLLLIAGAREILILKYFANPLYKTSTEVQIVKRISNESRSIRYCKVLDSNLFFGDNRGKISTMGMDEVERQEIESVIYKNSYNSNRELTQEYIFGSKHPAILTSKQMVLTMPRSYKVSRRSVLSMATIPSGITTIIYDTGYIKVYDKDFMLRGSIAIKQSFPELWEISYNFNTVKEEVRLIAQILRYLSMKDPVYSEYYTLTWREDRQGYHDKEVEIQNLTFQKTARMDPTPHNSKSVPHSLREIKRVLERQREQSKSNEKYQHMLVKAKSKQRKSKREIEDTKDILRFFNKEMGVKKLNPNKVPELPESVKNLESKLNRIVEDYVSESIKEESSIKRRRKQQNLGRRSTTKGKHQVIELEFLHTEIENEKLKRFSKSKSLSLPKLHFKRPKAAFNN